MPLFQFQHPDSVGAWYIIVYHSYANVVPCVLQFLVSRLMLAESSITHARSGAAFAAGLPMLLLMLRDGSRLTVVVEVSLSTVGSLLL